VVHQPREHTDPFPSDRCLSGACFRKETRVRAPTTPTAPEDPEVAAANGRPPANGQAGAPAGHHGAPGSRVSNA